METKEDEKAKLINGKIKPPHHHHSHANSTNLKGTLNFILLPFLWFVFLFFWLSHNKTIQLIQPNQNPTPENLTTTAITDHTTAPAAANNHTVASTSSKLTCQNTILPFYIYNLPSKFNDEFYNDCENLNKYVNMCPYLSNQGLGQSLPNMIPPTATTNSSSPGHWYSTQQFIAEIIFHARLQNHPCRVQDPNQAQLFYVPFYGGLYASKSFREKNHTVRDALATELVEFLVKRQPWWRKHNGADHFMAIGRTAWDFMRAPNVKPSDDFGANSLFNLSPIKSMAAVLTVERHPWAKESNQFAIPYPSYFHPTSSEEILAWQEYVRGQNRPYLFSFVGGTRKGVDEKGIIRNEVIDQCRNSSKCKIVDCSSGNPAAVVGKCYVAREVVNVMMSSKFCLQAPGDSYTRRSTFDSILTGCIPVFFSRHTAYTQYYWYLPRDYSEYSVFIDLKEAEKNGASVEEILGRISESRAMEMRDRVLSLLPNVTYMHPNSTDYKARDAVVVAMEGISDRVKSNLGFTTR